MDVSALQFFPRKVFWDDMRRYFVFALLHRLHLCLHEQPNSRQGLLKEEECRSWYQSRILILELKACSKVDHLIQSFKNETHYLGIVFYNHTLNFSNFLLNIRVKWTVYTYMAISLREGRFCIPNHEGDSHKLSNFFRLFKSRKYL